MNPDCHQIVPLIAGAVDDQLTDEQWEQLEAHLEHCAACRTLLEQQQETALGLEGLDPAFVQRDVWPAVRRSLPVKSKSGRLGWLAVIVALGILLKPIDLFVAGELGPLLRVAALLLIVVVFVLAGENPFRLADDAELGITDPATGTKGG